MRCLLSNGGIVVLILMPKQQLSAFKINFILYNLLRLEVML